LLLQDALQLTVDERRSWLIGDNLNDVDAGGGSSCRTVLLDNGHETEWEWSPNRRPELVAADLAHAARLILGADAVEKGP